MALKHTAQLIEPDLFTGASSVSDEPEPTYSVSQINQLVRAALAERFPRLLWVRGEVQGYDLKKARSYVSFKLAEKDAESDDIKAEVDVTIFPEDRQAIEAVLSRAENRFTLQDGIEVRFRVSVDFWTKYGKYRLLIRGIDPTYTLGRLAQNRQRILEELTRRRLLDRNKQVPIPLVPLRVGVIASLGSAGLRDLQTHLRQSGFAFACRIEDAAMQGQKVEAEVLAALARLNQRSDIDVIVITRGGGASTDMSWFDRMDLAEAVAMSRLPVLTGLGHTHDTSVLDIVACMNLKTPTDAAQFLVDRVRVFVEGLEDAGRQLGDRAQALLDVERGFVEEAARGISLTATAAVTDAHRWLAVSQRDAARRMSSLLASAVQALRSATARLTPERVAQRLRRDAQRLSEQGARLARESRHRLSAESERLRGWGGRLAALDPVNTLRRGFAIARNGQGRLVTSAAVLRSGDELVTQFHDGTVHSDVRSVQPETTNG
jgi:exodeoxyribonuclease VII large subunit